MLEKQFLFVRENLVLECILLLENFVVHDNVVDKWSWRHSFGDIYSVKGTYQYLVKDHIIVDSPSCNFIWKTLVHLQMSLLA